MTKNRCRWTPMRRLAEDARRDPGAALQLAAAKYLKAKGYSVLMTGIVKVQTWPGDLKGMCEVVIEFMAGRITEEAADARRPR